MRTINQEAATWVQIGLFAAIWIILLTIEGHTEISLRAFFTIPHVVFLYTVVVLIFRRWVWRWGVFRGWLVDLPDLDGEWTGHIETTWIDPATGLGPGPIEAQLTIAQTFSEISCRLRTPESTSESTAALLSKGETNGEVGLSYVYSSRPSAQVKHRSEIHDGAALLELKPGPRPELNGQYWTSRKSTGDMRFAYQGRRIKV